MADAYEFDKLETPESKVWGVYDGQTVRFKEEWFVIQALLMLKVDFSYQVPFLGGYYRRGGAVLDFICYVPPKMIIIRINGEHWHDKNSLEDTIMKEKLLRRYKGSAEVIDIDAEDVDTQEKANMVIREVLF